MSTFDIVISVVVLLVLVIIYSAYSDRKKKKQYLKELRLNGFSDHYILKGKAVNVAFDTNLQVAAFIFSSEIIKVPFNNILSWKHTKEKDENVIEFTVRNPDKPLLSVSISSLSYGKEWIARLSAILKS